MATIHPHNLHHLYPEAQVENFGGRVLGTLVGVQVTQTTRNRRVSIQCRESPELARSYVFADPYIYGDGYSCTIDDGDMTLVIRNVPFLVHKCAEVDCPHATLSSSEE